MELTKIRNWSDEELKTQETQASEQLFRIRFQSKLGQNDGVKRIRELRKDIARIQTVARERSLGIRAGATQVAAPVAVAKPAARKTRAKASETKAASTKGAK